MCINLTVIIYLLSRPQYGGNYCVGEARDYETCNTNVSTLATSYVLLCLLSYSLNKSFKKFTNFRDSCEIKITQLQ